MESEPTYTVVAIDPDTGERVTGPITGRTIEEAMIRAEGLPDPGVDDDDDD